MPTARITKPYTAKSRPIIFKAEMVRAILDGRKTQTRRVINPRSKNDFIYEPENKYSYSIRGRRALWHSFKTQERLIEKFCPYGVPSDFLYINEGFVTFSHRHVENHDRKYPIHRHLPHYPDCITLFKVDDYELPNNIKWSSPIFMRKNESRISLRIVDIRVERVQDIDDYGAIKEGVEPDLIGNASDLFKENDVIIDQSFEHPSDFGYWKNPKEKFIELWDSINAKRGYSWESNPWIFIISFQRAE